MLGELFSGRALRPSSALVREPVGGEAMAESAKTDATAAATAAEVPDEANNKGLRHISNDADDFSVEAVAEQLVTDMTSVAVCVSPEGDEGSAAAVMLARTVSSDGLKTVLIDLTGSACPTELMAESIRLPGLTDLMCGEISIADSIHPDRLSSSHIIPRGNANARRAMRAIDRLPMIIDALTEAYDLVVVECGAADAASIARISRAQNSEIVLSFLRFGETEIAELLLEFDAEGFENVLLMTPGQPASPLGSRNTAA